MSRTGLRDGARQHVPPVPRARARARRRARRPEPVHALAKPIITDSGGFQVFSMGHGGVADEIKGRGLAARGVQRGDPRDRRGGSPVPLLRRRGRAVPRPGDVDGGAGRARLGHRAGVRRVHAVSCHAATTRPGRRSGPTAGSRDACAGTPSTARPSRPSTGSSRAAWSPICGSSPRRPSPPADATGSRSAARSGQDKPQMHEVVDLDDAASSSGSRPSGPRHLLGIGDIDDLIAGVELGIDTFDCAMPTRLARHGVAIVPDPAARWRVDLVKSPVARFDRSRSWTAARAPPARRLTRAATCTTCCGPARSPALRLVTLHNLSFIARLMADLRGGDRRRPAAARPPAALRAGGAPESYFVYWLISAAELVDRRSGRRGRRRSGSARRRSRCCSRSTTAAITTAATNTAISAQQRHAAPDAAAAPARWRRAALSGRSARPRRRPRLDLARGAGWRGPRRSGPARPASRPRRVCPRSVQDARGRRTGR